MSQPGRAGGDRLVAERPRESRGVADEDVSANNGATAVVFASDLSYPEEFFIALFD